MKRLELSAAARADLAEIWVYTDLHWGAEQAERYGDLLHAGMVALASGKRHGVRSRITNYRKLAIRSHLVYYREEERVIRVARILHQKRDAARQLPA